MFLRPHQIETFQKILVNPRWMDRSQAGTGKTAPACRLTSHLTKLPADELVEIMPNYGISSANHILIDNFSESNSESIYKHSKGERTCRVIWIQPTSLMAKNKQELMAWDAAFQDKQVAVVTGSKTKKEAIIEDPNVVVWVMTAEAYKVYGEYMHSHYKDIVQIICDEPHLYYRGWESERTCNFIKYTPSYCRVLFMTATPTPRGKLKSAYTYCHVINPSFYVSYDFFMRIHVLLDKYGNAKHWINAHKLLDFFNHHSHCFTAKEVYGDVDQIILREQLELPAEIRKIYDQYNDEGIAEIQQIVLENKGAGTAAIRARQILAHPQIMCLPSEWDIKGSPTKFTDVVISNKVTPKMERLAEFCEEGEPIVVFASFILEVKAIVAYLIKKKFKVGEIYGEITTQQRNKVNEDFQKGKLDVVVCTAATAGVGYNWGHVNTVIFHTLNYGDDEFHQAIARAKRGVRNDILRIVILEYTKTIEHYVLWAVHKNSKISNSVNNAAEIIYFPKPLELIK